MIRLLWCVSYNEKLTKTLYFWLLKNKAHVQKVLIVSSKTFGKHTGISTLENAKYCQTKNKSYGCWSNNVANYPFNVFYFNSPHQYE